MTAGKTADLDADALDADPVEPALRTFADAISRGFASHPPLARLSFDEARRVAEVVRAPWRAGGPKMARTLERRVPVGDHEVLVRIHDPGPAAGGGDRGKGALVYLHGGGWTLFSLDTHDRVMREYAAGSGLMAVGVDYSLSPEAKFPVALSEVVGVLRWLVEAGPRLGIDPARLLVGGDSAGANLAIGACLTLREAGSGGLVRGMLLSYGAYDASLSKEARFDGPRFMLTAQEMAGFWKNYLNGPDDALNPLAFPILADLAGLPPAFMAIAECDILAEQNLAMAARLKAAGVEAEAVVYRGATHSFLEAVSISALSERALAEGGAWLAAIAGAERAAEAARPL